MRKNLPLMFALVGLSAGLLAITPISAQTSNVEADLALVGRSSN